MKIINKRNSYEYDTDYSEKELLILSKLILEFLENKEKTNPETLYKMISYFYDVKLETIDYIGYINKKTNSSFSKVVDVPTQQVTSVMDYEGHGRDFSWWTQNYRRMIKAASKEFVVTKDAYTFDEITKLIEDGEIYPIYPFGEKTKNSVNYLKDNTNYLVSYQSKELDAKDEYFEYMVAEIIKQIGIKTLIKDVKEFIIALKLNSHITNDEDMSDLEETADTLIAAFNQAQKDKINPSPIELVLNYLRDLPYEEFWYDKINMEQIIGVISMLDYEKDKIICDEIQSIAIKLKEVELCYELALNCDWVDKKVMAEIVIQDGNPDFNYYFASEVEGADIERHKQVILNNKRSDEYILERARNL